MANGGALGPVVGYHGSRTVGLNLVVLIAPACEPGLVLCGVVLRGAGRGANGEVIAGIQEGVARGLRRYS